MPKIGLGMNVLEATQERINWTFDNFERVYVSFSAGKDSTLMLHLVMQEAIKRNKIVGLMIIDLEGQYQLTIEHMYKCIEMYKDNIELFWVCLPIHLRNAVSTYEPFWVCWDKAQKKNWVREVPKYGITDEKFFPFFEDGMEFEEFVPLFGEWYSQGKSCACLVGIRADESLNRFRTIATTNKVRLQDKQYTTKVTDHCYNVYPIYDWKAQDLWHWHYLNPTYPSNALYDMMYKAGVPMGHMRICQPYGDDQRRGLWLFHLIEPNTWTKIVNRVSGANGGALYIKDTGNINGYNKISLPKNHTWESFSKMLLSSMPPKTKIHFENKIMLFVKWWTERGYEEGIPDQAPDKLEAKKKVPSWRRVAKCLLRNDFWCKGMGFSQHKSDAYKKYLALMEKRKLDEKYTKSLLLTQ